MSTPTPSAFSLFPSPNSSKPPPVFRNQTPKPRRSESRERNNMTPEPSSSSSPAPNPPHQNNNPYTNGRAPHGHAVVGRTFSPIQLDPPPTEAVVSSSKQDQQEPQHAVQQPLSSAQVPGRSETAFSQANTLIRSPSAKSRSSIAKPPLDDDQNQNQQAPKATPVAVQSIFPTYNPDVPLDRQEYGPMPVSPPRVLPRTVVSRQTYHEHAHASPPFLSPVRSPGSAANSGRWGNVPPPGSTSAAAAAAAMPGPHEAPLVPPTSSADQAKSLWKVANGWQASQSEGRVYCLKLSQEKDAPVYTLSSASQPFYRLRLDPTSASARVSLARHDPSKTCKPSVGKGPSSSASSIISDMVHGSPSSNTTSTSSDSKHWHEAISTSLEEESRRHPPHDGLVALLMPTAATRVALEKPHDPSSVFMAERECARLVWDDDSANHFLVHPALATPFCVTIERYPSWSRVEYTLEHNESPQHVAKLTRDGTGGGWLEVDTGIAAKVESYYLVDVAVAALLLVAAADEKNVPAVVAEMFAPPPPVVLSAREEKRLSRASKREGKKRRKMESFELDLESQNDSLGKTKAKSSAATADDKLPFVVRAVVKLVKGLFKLFIWVLTIVFKCIGGVGKLLYKCVGSKY